MNDNGQQQSCLHILGDIKGLVTHFLTCHLLPSPSLGNTTERYSFDWRGGQLRGGNDLGLYYQSSAQFLGYVHANSNSLMEVVAFF